MKAFVITFSFIFLYSISIYAQINFADAISHTVGSDIASAAIGDVNNDGLNDAIVATTFYFDPDHDYSIFVFLQQADGSVAEPVRYKYSDSYGSSTVVQIADLNNDNRKDVVFAFSDSIGILYQNSNGGLNPIESMYSGNKANGLKCGDLNNDGLIDIAICHGGENFIGVFYQRTSGGFQQTTYPIEVQGWMDEIDVNDMNGDGLNDVIYMPAAAMGSAVSIFYQDSSTGLLGLPVGYDFQISYYNHFNGIGTGDLNNDGLTDLVGSIGGNTAWIAISYQQADGTMGPATFLPSFDIPTPVEIADLNCDNKNEIIVGHDGWGRFSVWEQHENGNFSDYKLYGSLYNIGPYGLAVGDINNDSRQDVLAVGGLYTAYFMYNTSAPDNTLPLDTIVTYIHYEVDTTNTWTSTYSSSEIKIVNECKLKLSYKLSQTTYSVFSNIEGDSLFLRSFIICGLQQSDTLKYHFANSNWIEITNTDTTVLSVDTLIENMVYINTWLQNDTSSLQPISWQDILVQYSYKTTSDSIFVIIDSLSVNLLMLRIDYTVSEYYDFEGIKCGYYIRDTLVNSYPMTDYIVLNSDTTIISHTETGYPYGINETAKISGIKLYPNPASENCILEFRNELKDTGPFTFRIFNSAGQQIWETEIPASEIAKITIGVEGFKPGTYTVHIQGDKSMGSTRLVIAR